LIQTGRRTVVIAQSADGKFQPVEVETGGEANGQTEIRKGLAAGQKIVISGQFLIDSESNLKSTTDRMSAPPAAKDTAAANVHRGTGRVEAISKEAVTLSHAPITTLEWPAMTMDFKLPAAGLPKNVHKGDRVTFEFRLGADGQATLSGITPTAPDNAQAGK
jgi:Cu(I)/Ag(I) efflux system membrane fusion protein